MENSVSGPASKGRFEVLDSLRGVAALLVVLYHYRNGSFFADLPFVRGSYLFVDFFFVLSGFVIGWSYGNRIHGLGSGAQFLIRRFFRLVPLHFFILFVYMAIELALMASQGFRQPMGAVSGRTAADFVRTVLLMNSFGADHGTYWNLPSWSISAEWWTYILFGVIVLLLRRVMFVPGLLLMSAVGLVVLVMNHSFMNIVWDHGIFRCFYGFGLGAILAHFWPRMRAMGDRVRARVWGITEILLVVAIVLFVRFFYPSPVSFTAPLLFVATVAVFAREEGPVSKFLKRSFFLRAGVLSYSIYLGQQLVMGRVRNATDFVVRTLHVPVRDIPFFAELQLCAVLVGVWIFASLTWRFVEVPGQKLGRFLAQRLNRRPGVEGGIV